MKETVTGRFQRKILSHIAPLLNVGHVLHLFNVERDAHLPTLKGSGSIIFGVLIYYGDPACAGFTGDAISGIAKDDPAAVGRSLDFPLIHNSVHELGEGVMC